MPTSRCSCRFAVVALVLACPVVAQHRWTPLGALPRFVAFGTGQGSVPIAGGCSLLVDPVFGTVIVWVGSGSVSRLRMPIPAVSAFLGWELTAQGFVLDGTGPFGASASRGLRLRLGR